MQTHPCTDVASLWKAAGDVGTVMVMSLLPDAARSLSARLGLDDGASARKILAEKLALLGVREVFWDDSLEREQIRAEAGELLRRLENPAGLPLLLSGCWGWRGYAEQGLLELCPRFDLPGPRLRCRSLAMRSMLSARLGAPFSRIAHVTVAGCDAQRAAYGSFGETPQACIGQEYVITARELALWLSRQGVLPIGGHDRAAPEPFRGRLQRVLEEAARMRGETAFFSEAFCLSPAGGNPCVREGATRLMGWDVPYAQVLGVHEIAKQLPRLLGGQWPVRVAEVLACVGCR